MNKIGLLVTLNKFTTYFETIQIDYVCETLDEAKEMLVNYLANHFKDLNIDYPLELIEFEYHWFKQQYVNSNSFYYKIFMDGKWSEPWETQDIYSDVYDKMLEYETNNPPDFSEIYGEPNPDEEKMDKFTMEQSEEIKQLEKKLGEILDQAKVSDNKTDQVKECFCDKCVTQREEDQ